MSLRSVKVTAAQHFVQSFLQGLVWSRDNVSSQKQTTTGRITSGAKKAYRLFLPRPCPGPPAAPTSGATPARIGRSTWKKHDKVKARVGTNSLLEAALKANTPHVVVPLRPDKLVKLIQGSEVSIGEQRRPAGVGSLKRLSDVVFTQLVQYELKLQNRLQPPLFHLFPL